jgi:hypothetical protein
VGWEVRLPVDRKSRKKEQRLPDDLTESSINGTDAHQWYICMEDNLNRATNQFQRDNYTKYTRSV